MADPEAEQRKIERLKALLEQDPNDEVALFSLGKAYLKLRQHEQAIAALDRCLGVNPRYSAAYQALAVALYKAGQVERSIQIARTGVDVSAANGDLMVTNQLEQFLEQVGE